jgi:hypothetical protein
MGIYIDPQKYYGEYLITSKGCPSPPIDRHPKPNQSYPSDTGHVKKLKKRRKEAKEDYQKNSTEKEPRPSPLPPSPK